MNALFSSTALSTPGVVPGSMPPHFPPVATFGIDVEALTHIPDLRKKVLQNLRSALRKCANAMSPLGLQAEVDIAAVGAWIDRVAPEQLGFTHPGSFSAFRSNLWRALRLAGHCVPRDRYDAGLSEPWAALQAKLEDLRVRKKLSRFMHLASERAWSPSEVTEPHLQEFRLALAETCLKSKADKTFRDTVREWNRAVDTIDGWPARHLHTGARKDWIYILPWVEFPSSYRDDVETFIIHFDFDSLGPIPGGGLHARTKDDYRDGLRRAASILVRLGTAPDSITSLRVVVKPAMVKGIIRFLWERNGEKTGGHAAFMAFLLLMVARDHVHAHTDVGELRRLFWKTAKTDFGAMADRTWERLIPFDDPIVLEKFKALPQRLVHGVLGRPVDISTAKTVGLPYHWPFISRRRCRPASNRPRPGAGHHPECKPRRGAPQNSGR